MLWRERRWRLLLNIIDHLPRNSFTVEALLNDEEFAAMLVRERNPKVPGERLAEWSPERETLAQVVDAVMANTGATLAAAGVAPPPFHGVVRPITALDKAKQAKRRADHEALVARVLPGRNNN